MKFIIGQDRCQIPLFASSIEAAIAQDNEIAYKPGRIMNFIGNDRLKAYFKALLFIICSIIVHFKVFCRMKYLCPDKLYLKYALPISNLLPNFNPDYSLKITVAGGF